MSTKVPTPFSAFGRKQGGDAVRSSATETKLKCQKFNITVSNITKETDHAKNKSTTHGLDSYRCFG